MSQKEWVYLCWNYEELCSGHPAQEDLRRILDGIGAPHGFSVENAFHYAAPQRERLEEFSLRVRES
jgi:hypothetical protein